MASPEEIKKLIQELGCFYQEDSELGHRVDAIFQEVGYYFKNVPGLAFAKANTFENELRVLMINVWTCDSVAVFHLGSHKHLLGAGEAPNGLLRISPEKLGLPGIVSKTVPMKTGGLSILDGRTGFRIVSGQAISFAFVVPDELPYWGEMVLPQGEGLERIVQLMEEISNHIGTNFKFQAARHATKEAA
ncbi:hypothetical protein B0I35DRAFT_455432 [Stachybotrys elegans]|uniref:Uncharacterized protein n=1 Tax=Stachybotrys elegans TaxID=80388 RepID=A0A8K0SC07_9HYPO|nr:hypothetical protein B0I35DRAFT_455432 [Stachybotrys elegans]